MSHTMISGTGDYTRRALRDTIYFVRTQWCSGYEREEGTIRLISARSATKQERQDYEEHTR